MFSFPLNEDAVGRHGGGGWSAAVDRATFDAADAASFEFPDAARFRMKAEMSLKPAPFDDPAVAVC